MAGPQNLLDYLRLLVAPPEHVTDTELLDRFVQGGDQSAFTALVSRYGPMVMRICRRGLADSTAAEDCFQATFMILARKAGSIRRAPSLPSWIHGVALRVARDTRKAHRQPGQLPASASELIDSHPDPLQHLTTRELLLAVDEEVQRLPEKDQLGVILCCLENLSREAAARRLGWTPASVKARLERGRRRLEARLARRGFTLSSGLAAALISGRAGAAGAGLRAATVKAALAFGSGIGSEGAKGMTVATVIAERVLRNLALGKVAICAAGVSILLAVIGSAGSLMFSGQAEKEGHGVPPTNQVLAAVRPRAFSFGKALREIEPDKQEPRLVAPLGHGGGVNSGVFSHDGKLILTGSDDTTAKLWDRASGKEIRTFQGHMRSVESVAFSPDGRFVLTGSSDKTARLWDAISGQEIRSFRGHVAGISSVAFSPDGKQVITGSADKTARLWETVSGKEIRGFQGHNDQVRSVAFSPDGKQILTASEDKTARLWDVGSGKEICIFGPHPREVTAAAISPDGKLVLVGGSWGARLWRAATGEEILNFAEKHGRVTSVAFSADGKQMLTGHIDNGTKKTVTLWDVASGSEVRAMNEQMDGEWIHFVAFSPNGKDVIAGDLSSTVRLWEAASGEEIRTLNGRSQVVNSVAFSPDGKLLLIGASRVARLWDTAVGHPIMSLDRHKYPVVSVVFSPDGMQVLTGSFDASARLWDTASAREVRVFEDHVSLVRSVAFSPNGKLILTGNEDKTARLWDAASGAEIRLLAGHTGPIKSVAFSPDGQLVLTGSDDKTARLWRMSSGKEIRRFIGQPEQRILSVAFSADGNQVVTGDFQGKVRLWEVASGKARRVLLGHTNCVSSVAFSPDGRRLLSGSYDHTARLWDVLSGDVHQIFKGHTGLVMSATFSPDAKRALTGSWDGTARLWDCASGKELCSLLNFPDGTWAVLDPAGRYDSSNGGDIEWLHGIVGNEIIPLKQLKEERYDPCLLAKYMGFNKEPLRKFDTSK